MLLRANPLDDVANTTAIDGVVLRGAFLPRDRLDAIRAAMDALRDR